MIPQEKCAAVARGLREAFGAAELEEIRVITVGQTTSRVYRIVVSGSAYLLKIILRGDDASRHYANMRTAAEGGLAPRVWYTNVEDKVSITDFVEALPFPAAEALVRMPRVLRALHGLAPFAGVPHQLNTSCMFLMNKGPALDGFLDRMRTGRFLPEGEKEEVLALHGEMAAIYPMGSDMVSSHNDLFKPDNVLFDGGRVWLVDWEAAFLNDRYADLAVVANLVVSNEAEERMCLEEYFGGPPDAYQQARVYLAQQVAHMFYGMAFLMIGSTGKEVNWGEKAPGYEEFHERFRTGALRLEDSGAKIAYGRVHWERLRENMRGERLREAMRMVSGVGGGSGVTST